MEKKTDLRVIKTKRNIHKAFIALAMKKDVNKISVKEICAQAECGRSTFYMYYPYKEALHEEIINAVLNEILEGFRPLPNFVLGLWEDISEEYLHKVLSSLYQIKNLFPILPPGSEVFNTFAANLIDRMIEYIYQQTLQLYDTDDDWKRTRIYALERAMFSGIINEAIYCYTKTDYSVEFVHDLIRPLFLACNEEIEKIRIE